MLDAQGFQVVPFARAAGRGENLRADSFCNLDRRQSDATRSCMHEHALAGPQLAQSAQGQMGGHEADGYGGSFLKTQMLRFGNGEFGERDDITGKAGRSQGDYLISRLEAVDSRPTATTTPEHSPPSGPGSPGYKFSTLSTSRKLSPVART